VRAAVPISRLYSRGSNSSIRISSIFHIIKCTHLLKLNCVYIHFHEIYFILVPAAFHISAFAETRRPRKKGPPEWEARRGSMEGVQSHRALLFFCRESTARTMEKNSQEQEHLQMGAGETGRHIALDISCPAQVSLHHLAQNEAQDEGRGGNAHLARAVAHETQRRRW
jgi:hypothetical protein